MNALGMNLKQWRAKQGLTMDQAAPLLGISQPTISRIEDGTNLPNSTTMKKLAEKTGGAITFVALVKAWEAAQRKRAA